MTVKINPVIQINKESFLDYTAILCALFGIGRIAWDGYYIVLLLFTVMWVVIALPWVLKLNFLKNKGCLTFLFFFILYMILLIVSDDTKIAISYGGTYAIYLIVLFMSTYYFTSGKGIRLKRIVKFSFIWIGVMCICAMLYYSSHPGAARLYVTHRSNLDGYMIGGGYQLAYISAILLPVCGQYVIERKLKTWFTVLVFLMIGLVLETSSMLIIITAIIGCVIEYAYSGHGKKKIYIIIMLSLVGAILYFMRASIGQLLIDIAGGRTVTSFADMNNAVFARMTEIGMVLAGSDIGNASAMVLRIQNYIKPIEYISRHPFLGGIVEYGVSPESGIFNDSTIISALAGWGIPMGGMFLSPFWYSFKSLRNHKGSIIAVIMTLLLNPSIGFSVVYGACFLLPAFDKVYDKEIYVRRQAK